MARPLNVYTLLQVPTRPVVVKSLKHPKGFEKAILELKRGSKKGSKMRSSKSDPAPVEILKQAFFASFEHKALEMAHLGVTKKFQNCFFPPVMPDLLEA